ncbi:MAG: sugar phosphate nucleotidyltransferase [Candidatus Margulisiibacteriota bacterium]
MGRVMLLGLVGGIGSRPWPLTAHPKVDSKKIAAIGLNKGSVNTNAFPKPLTPLGGTPLMLPLFKSAVDSCGIQDVAMALMYMPEDIRAYFGPNMEGLRQGTGSSFYWEHQHEFNLNTAGCLVKGWQEDIKGRDGHPDTFIVLSADIRAKTRMHNMLDLHKQHHALVSIGLAPVPWKEIGRFGVAYRKGDSKDETGRISSYDGGKYSRIKHFQEKSPKALSNLNNGSIYIIDHRLFELIEDDIEIPDNRNQLDPRLRPLSLEDQKKLNPYDLYIPDGKFDPARGNYLNDWTNPETGKHYRLGVFSAILNQRGKLKEGEANKNFQDWGSHVFPDIVSHHPMIYESEDPGVPQGLYGYLIGGLWADDGTRRAIYGSNLELLSGMGGFNRRHDFDWWPKPPQFNLDENNRRIWYGKNVTIEQGAKIVGPTIIGDNVTIRKGAILVKSVIGSGWTIEGNARLVNSVLWPDRNVFGLAPIEPDLKYTLNDIQLENVIVGGGFYKEGRENVFYTDIAGTYIQEFTEAPDPYFNNVVMVPSPSHATAVIPLDQFIINSD